MTTQNSINNVINPSGIRVDTQAGRVVTSATSPATLFGYSIPGSTFINDGDFILWQGSYLASIIVSGTYTITFNINGTAVYTLNPTLVGTGTFNAFVNISMVKTGSFLTVTITGSNDSSTGIQNILGLTTITPSSFGSSIPIGVNGSVSVGTSSLTSYYQILFGNV